MQLYGEELYICIPLWKIRLQAVALKNLSGKLSWFVFVLGFFFLILIFVNKGIKINLNLKSWNVKNEKMIKWLYQK